MVNTNSSDIVLEKRANGVLAFNVHSGQYYGFYPYKVWSWHDAAQIALPLACSAPNQRFYVHYADIICAVNTQGLVERHFQLTGIQDSNVRVFLELVIGPSNAAEPCNEVRRVYPGLLFDAGTPIDFATTFNGTDEVGFTVVYAEIDDIRG